MSITAVLVDPLMTTTSQAMTGFITGHLLVLQGRSSAPEGSRQRIRNC